jgi:hypothetical protein
MVIEEIYNKVNVQALQQEVESLIKLRGLGTDGEHQFSITTHDGREDWAQGRGYTVELAVPPTAQTEIIESMRGSYLEYITVRRHRASYRWRLWRLPPGRCMMPHSDGPGKRIHIPVFTNELCWLSVWDSPPAPGSTSTHSVTYQHLEVGKIYLLDSEQYHSAANHSDQDRWHLIGCTS